MKCGDKVRSRKVEKKVINGRVMCAAGVMALATSVLTYNVFNVAVLQHGGEAAVAKNNALKTIEISPTRGKILDRNGDVLATSRPSYNLAVTPEKIPLYMSAEEKQVAVGDYLDILGKFISISPKERSVYTKKILQQ